MDINSWLDVASGLRTALQTLASDEVSRQLRDGLEDNNINLEELLLAFEEMYLILYPRETPKRWSPSYSSRGENLGYSDNEPPFHFPPDLTKDLMAFYDSLLILSEQNRCTDVATIDARPSWSAMQKAATELDQKLAAAITV